MDSDTKGLRKYFRELGAAGGSSRAEKHTKEELAAWSRLGGRPNGSGKKKTDEKGASKNERQEAARFKRTETDTDVEAIRGTEIPTVLRGQRSKRRRKLSATN